LKIESRYGIHEYSLPKPGGSYPDKQEVPTAGEKEAELEGVVFQQVTAVRMDPKEE
jgi:hypothetical protein